MSIYCGKVKVSSMGVMNISEQNMSSYVKQEELSSFSASINEKVDNLAQTVENYHTEVNETITETINNTFQEYTNNMSINNPESLLPLDSSKFYNQKNCFTDPNVLSATDTITLCEIDSQQQQNMRVTIEYDSIANDESHTAKIQIYVYDTSSQKDILFDTLFTDLTAKTHHKYQKWFNCTSGQKIKITASPKAKGTKINANLKVNLIDVFQVSDTDILDWTSHQIPVAYSHLASSIFKYDETASGKMIVVGRVKRWSTNVWYMYNSVDTTYRTMTKRIEYWNLSANKRIKYIPYRVIPTLEYCISGYGLDGAYGVYCADPCYNAKYQKLSAQNYYVFNDTLSCEISDIGLKGTSSEYRINNATFSSVFEQLSGTNFIKDTELYNRTLTSAGKDNNHWMALVKVYVENGKYKYDVIQTKNYADTMATYQFNELDVEPGDMYCILTNTWMNKNKETSWDFKTHIVTNS